MKPVAGWWCPDLLSGPGKYLQRTDDLSFLLAHVLERGCCVQAGGHIGTWPITLAETFERVLTFEPDPENFDALRLNIGDRGLRDRVVAQRAVLGKKRGAVSMRRSSKNTGQHRVGSTKGGTTPMLTIDSLELDRVGAIVLDVEGYEIPALLGARKTLERHRPLIQAEENKRCRDHGYEIGDLERVLRTMGYRLAAQIHEDLVFLPE